jgi:hypothetical protein
MPETSEPETSEPEMSEPEMSEPSALRTSRFFAAPVATDGPAGGQEVHRG